MVRCKYRRVTVLTFMQNPRDIRNSVNRPTQYSRYVLHRVTANITTHYNGIPASVDFLGKTAHACHNKNVKSPLGLNDAVYYCCRMQYP